MKDNIVILSLETSTINYNIAWNLIKDRFQNKRVIVFNLLDDLFNINKLTIESAIGLRNLNDEAMKNIRALKALGLQFDACEAMVIYLIINKFDETTRKEWEGENKKDDLPTLDHLLLFLKQRCQVLESMQCISNKENVKSVNNIKCQVCGQNHVISKCFKFLNLNISERLTIVK